MSHYAAAIFDLDGTLIDTERPVIDSGLAVLDAMGHDLDRGFLLGLIGIDAPEGARRLTARLGPAFDFAAFDAAWRVAADAAFAAGIPPMPGVEALLGELERRGMPRAVATNSATGSARRKLRAAGLAARFAEAHVVGFDVVARPKPAADVYLEAAARLGVPPAACVAFEDSDPGVAAALAAGMTVVHVPDMAPARRRDAHHLADSILDGARACGLI